jgi:hypothetical protein
MTDGLMPELGNVPITVVDSHNAALQQHTILTAGGAPTGDMVGQITSEGIALGTCTRFTIQLHAMLATHVGALAIQVCDDTVNWNAVPLDNGGAGVWWWNASYGALTIPVAAGAVFDATIDLDLASSRVRYQYVPTGGIGTLTGVITFK